MDTTQTPSGSGLTGRIIIQEKLQLNMKIPHSTSRSGPPGSAFPQHKIWCPGERIRPGSRRPAIPSQTAATGSGIATKDQGKVFQNGFATKTETTGHTGGKNCHVNCNVTVVKPAVNSQDSNIWNDVSVCIFKITIIRHTL